VRAGINVVPAPSDAESDFLSSSMNHMVRGIITGARRPLQPPVANVEEILTYLEREAVDQMLAVSFIGGPDRLKASMAHFISQTRVDEVIVSSNVFEHGARLRSFRLFAEVMGVAERKPA